jgi:CubicO group peptidase (beta-lactamase class C family)
VGARASGAVLAVAAALAAAPAAGQGASADVTQGERFRSFMALGGDPLVIPADWYQPRERVAGGAIGHGAHARAADNARLDAVFASAQASGASALIVWRAAAPGRPLVHRDARWGTDAQALLNPQSMSKTLAALLVGVAIAEGSLPGPDAPVGRWLTEWAGDPRGRITIRQLLTMASGLAQITGAYGYRLVPENPGLKQNFGDDFLGPALGIQLADPPGTKFDYNNNATLLLSVVLSRATGQRYADYLSAKLWAPLGLSDAFLYLDRPGGQPMTSCCVLSGPEDWLAIGRLILDRGKAPDGRQLVPADWIDAMVAPSPANPRYGFQLWRGDQRVGGPPAPVVQPGTDVWQSEPFLDPGTIILLGYGYQRVWVLPAQQLVIVRMGRAWPQAWDEAAIPNAVVRALGTAA